MARVKFGALYSTDVLNSTGQMTLDRHNKTQAEFYAPDSGNSFVLTGHDFTYKDGEIVKGTITKIEFDDKFGDHYLSISALHIKTHHLSGAMLGDLLTESFSGNDKVIGSTESDHFLFGGIGDNTIIGLYGDDNLVGLSGNDTYTGNLGSDTFAVGFGYGKDIITDFDAKGGGSNQDYMLLQDAPDFRKHQRGDDTVIDFGHGNTVTLLNVDVHDITKSDFSYPL